MNQARQRPRPGVSLVETLAVLLILGALLLVVVPADFRRPERQASVEETILSLRGTALRTGRPATRTVVDTSGRLVVTTAYPTGLVRTERASAQPAPEPNRDDAAGR